MRVLLTTNFSPWSAYSGGGQRSTHNLACALSQRGHSVTVVFTKSPLEHVPLPAQLPYSVRWAELLDLKSRVNAPLRPLTAFSVARVVHDELRDWSGPAVVHGNGEEVAAMDLLRRQRRFGLICTPRYPSYPASFVAHQSSAGGRVWNALRYPKYAALGAALRGADFCCPPSRHSAGEIARVFSLPPAKVQAVHNGVPAEFLAYTWRGDSSGPVLFFGRFERSKGADVLLEALGKLGARAPRVQLVGRGPLEGWLRARIVELGLSQRVELRGWADHDALGALLEQASLAVLPSLEENFSLAVLSALCVGTPLITTPVGGTPELIESGQTGVLVKAGDSAELAGALEELGDDPARAAAIGARGRELVRASFTWAAAAAKFERLYEAVA
jgi:glycosyltransferase involved in cell wall biosynthesis